MTLVYFCFNGNVKKLIKDEDSAGFSFLFKRYYRLSWCGSCTLDSPRM